MKIIFRTFFVCLFVFILPVFSQGQRNEVNNSADDFFIDMERIINEADRTYTPMDEYYIGRAVSVNILTNYRLYTSDNELTNYLNQICSAIIINSLMPASYNGYFAAILDSNELNAFASPGGHIFITRGLIDAVPSEDALAGIIAHEAAHIMLRHGIKTIEEMRLITEVDVMAEQAGFNNNLSLDFNNYTNDFFDFIIRSGYTIPQELEADTIAIILLINAGYSPSGLLEVLRILQRNQGSNRSSLGNIYPALSDRIRNLENRIANIRIQDNTAIRQNRFMRITGRERN
ncbi:MAG: M48 family metalloprotease [Treponema sp.]|nr:M48 family metalloprotease [Treponema sp.]